MEKKRQIVECVPNFSEGRNVQTIEAIAEAIRSTAGCTLLDVDAGVSTNRTVYTFVGTPDAVIEGAVNAAKVAYKLIDMRKHSGEHKRLGAMDVCPFIPVRGVEMEECIYCARTVAERLGSELKVPVFLYGYASVQSHRQTVPEIRSGEYEGLRDKLLLPEWQPDFGPADFVETWGGTMVGARKFLIAYNVNLIATKEQAHRIACNVREQGRMVAGQQVKGRLKQVQAAGWFLKEENVAQVSVNILDFEVTALHTVFEEIVKDATDLKLPVLGSQVVGLIPLQPLLAAADYYVEKEGLFVLEEEQRLALAVNRLGLNSLAPFDPKKRVIEYLVQEDEADLLVNLSLKDFIKTVGDRTTAPGGGSVAAAVASLGASLASMVAKLSFGKKAFEENDEKMRNLIPIFHNAFLSLTQMVDEDTKAYNEYVAAYRLPNSTPEQQDIRSRAIESGIKGAIHVPLTLALSVSQLWDPCLEVASLINVSSASDLQVGVQCLKTAVIAAYYNVVTNLTDCKDEDYKKQAEADINRVVKQAEEMCNQVLDVLEKRKKQ